MDEDQLRAELAEAVGPIPDRPKLRPAGGIPEGWGVIEWQDSIVSGEPQRAVSRYGPPPKAHQVVPTMVGPPAPNRAQRRGTRKAQVTFRAGFGLKQPDGAHGTAIVKRSR